MTKMESAPSKLKEVQNCQSIEFRLLQKVPQTINSDTEKREHASLPYPTSTVSVLSPLSYNVHALRSISTPNKYVPRAKYKF
jgi:hypothetical protein